MRTGIGPGVGWTARHTGCRGDESKRVKGPRAADCTLGLELGLSGMSGGGDIGHISSRVQSGYRWAIEQCRKLKGKC